MLICDLLGILLLVLLLGILLAFVFAVLRPGNIQANFRIILRSFAWVFVTLAFLFTAFCFALFFYNLFVEH